ncbi:hybrid sensor histidine kinase/response regulator [Actibacterium ureilyticum]|uniref:hybrid sensor histidine kinase/response regulator n=1 Tax=Actibacterium ureilyticum TaxID=1590614 RepID=UPI000BAAF757|nr:PAS domain-containing hybrid sensor histidine kinase/response regulator [Actibacterium ureilyticum]
MSGLRNLRRRGSVILVLVAALCVATIAFLAVEIVRDLRLLSSANSDNVQWTLSQAEVEFLEFQHALDLARENHVPDLEAVRREFDIFYSRMSTLSTGALYAPLRDLPEFGSALNLVKSRLDAMIPLIDGDPAALRAGLETLAEGADASRGDVRRIANSGLLVFAEQSDARRRSIAVTLLRMAFLTTTLVVALVILMRHAQIAGRVAKRRGRELTSALSRMDTILEASLDALVVSDLQGRILDFNSVSERIFGYRREDVIGRTLGDILIPDHLRDAHEAGMRRFALTGERHVVGMGRVELEAQRKNGEVFPVELALEMADTESGQIIIGFLRDISQRVKDEAELVEARDSALAGEKAKAEFLAMMTHEIRTPLNGVLGNLSLLRKTRLDSEQERFVRHMGISGKLLMSHVDAVLDIARFESGMTETQGQAVHLGRLVQDIVDSQLGAAEAHGNIVEWSWTGPPATWVEVDSSRLQQVILNLLGNAIKFTTDGRIAIELEQVGADGAAAVEFRIIDTGIGIAEADLSRVFDDFESLAKPLKSDLGGTGLGLGIAKRFVTAMGGEIGVESTLDEGSVFWFRIPVVPASATDATDSHAPDTAALRGLRILVAEDNEINLHLAQDLLGGMGHKVTAAQNGLQAVDIAQHQRFDLVLMDIRMPVMDGLAATRAIREGGGPNADIPIVAFSANVLPEAKDRFLSGGMSAFLGKPLDPDELVMLLNRLCGPDAAAPATPPVSAPAAKAPPPPRAPADPIAALKDRYLAEAAALFDWLAGAPGDMAAIADRCHQIAGSAAAFGQPDLRTALLHVEAAAEAGDHDRLARAIADARVAWHEAPAPRIA